MKVDGNTILAEDLRGKPAPDTLLAACRKLGVEPQHAAAFETTPAGIAAAQAAGFRIVVAVTNTGQREALRAEAPNIIVSGLAELLDHKLVA